MSCLSYPELMVVIRENKASLIKVMVIAFLLEVFRVASYSLPGDELSGDAVFSVAFMSMFLVYTQWLVMIVVVVAAMKKITSKATKTITTTTAFFIIVKTAFAWFVFVFGVVVIALSVASTGLELSQLTKESFSQTEVTALITVVMVTMVLSYMYAIAVYRKFVVKSMLSTGRVTIKDSMRGLFIPFAGVLSMFRNGGIYMMLFCFVAVISFIESYGYENGYYFIKVFTASASCALTVLAFLLATKMAASDVEELAINSSIVE
jgi:hypothetical protein